MSEKGVYIGETSIQIGQHGFINQPKEIIEYIKYLQNQLQQKENIIKEVREDLYQVVKWCTENKHNEDTIERYLVVDYGTIVGKINEIRTKLDKGE